MHFVQRFRRLACVLQAGGRWCAGVAGEPIGLDSTQTPIRELKLTATLRRENFAPATFPAASARNPSGQRIRCLHATYASHADPCHTGGMDCNGSDAACGQQPIDSGRAGCWRGCLSVGTCVTARCHRAAGSHFPLPDTPENQPPPTAPGCNSGAVPKEWVCLRLVWQQSGAQLG